MILVIFTLFYHSRQAGNKYKVIILLTDANVGNSMRGLKCLSFRITSLSCVLVKNNFKDSFHHYLCYSLSQCVS